MTIVWKKVTIFCCRVQRYRVVGCFLRCCDSWLCKKRFGGKLRLEKVQRSMASFLESFSEIPLKSLFTAFFADVLLFFTRQFETKEIN
jgi:hypothetical protein